MPNKFNLLVFDWDGTLIDSTGLIVWAIQHACRDLGLPVPADAAARYVIGLGLHPALSRLLPGVSSDLYPAIAQRYRIHFLTRDHETPLFEGVPELLTELRGRGHKLAVATGKSRSGLDRALKHVGLGPLFEATRCGDETHSKPHPAMLHELMDELAIDQSQTLMIGDTTHDLDMAINASVASLGVGYGAHAETELRQSNPLAVVNSVSSLSAWLSANA